MAEFTFGFGVDKNHRVASDLTELVGSTPMLNMSRFAAAEGCEGKIIAKLEYMNPLGSSKDRAALSMVEQAEKSGALRPGGVIIEPTSGNTGIGLAFVAAIKGYELILTMPENMSEERKKILRMLGAKLMLTPAAEGMEGAVRKANELAAQTENSWIPNQFGNPANADAHRKTTAPEILRDLYGKVDVFVAGVGTGGTVTGVGELLKAYNPFVKIVAVEPAESPLLSEGRSGSHGADSLLLAGGACDYGGRRSGDPAGVGLRGDGDGSALPSGRQPGPAGQNKGQLAVKPFVSFEAGNRRRP